MGSPLDRHIDNRELSALVPWSPDAGQEPHGLSPDSVREAELHIESCADCAGKVSRYWQLVNGFSKVVVAETARPGAACPKDDGDVDWREVAAGLWPELKATQLIQHAAFCDHCGPLLRAATSELQTPARAGRAAQPLPASPAPRQFIRWMAPVLALMVIVAVGVLGIRTPSPSSSSSSVSLPGSQFAEFAAVTHRQHAQGRLALEVRSDSQQTVNEWFQAKSPFTLALPASVPLPGEERPYQLEGARLVQIGSKTAAYIAYQMPAGPVSLMVTPESVAVATGGTVVDYKKVSFHYAVAEGYKVVTWSQHGLTYALVSQEGNSTQRSCMVCHSAMRDRDLSGTASPLPITPDPLEPALQ